MKEEREFSDEVYEKIDQALEAVKNENYCTIEEFENEMKNFFKELKEEFDSSKIIADNKEGYSIDGKI